AQPTPRWRGAEGVRRPGPPPPPAPASPPAAAPPTSPFSRNEERTRHNAAALDELAARTAKLYYESPAARTRWESLVAAYRQRALAARTDEELRAVLHSMLRERPPYRAAATGRAAISSAHPVATAAGLEILRKGGNVVDAAAAVSFALGVVEPDASGLGGYGQMVVYRTAMSKPQLVEFMSRVPEAAG